MTRGDQIRFWIFALAAFVLLLYLLSGILLPFVAGMAIAYLLDPLCDRLEEWKLSRTLATVVVTLAFILVCVLVALLVVPTLVSQLTDFIQALPDLLKALRDWIYGLAALVQAQVDEETLQRIRDALSGFLDGLANWGTTALTGLITGGVAFLNLLSLVVITPVVAFYLLRDWDKLVALVDTWLPREHAPVIREQAREVDRTLAGFIRGQGMVCLILAAYYALGLTLAGLQFGLVIGLIAGLLSFIPFVGAMIGLVLSVGLAFFQFDNLMNIAIVAAVFFVGQAVEGNVLTPKLVGDRVGLHPVWVMFALLAGGTLLGFLGVLVAVPVAAVIGVGVRFAIDQYRRSAYYLGNPRAPGDPRDSDDA